MELRPDSHGKVRDIYDCGDSLLMVASDRISAYDFILPDEIPHKGEILTRISAFWFERFADLIPNHMISCDVADLPEEYAPYADYLAGRSMLVKKAQTVPIECIVRGYLTGSGKKTYDEDGTVCGIKLPDGLTGPRASPRPPSSPSRSSPRPPRPSSATTTRTSPLSAAARSWARTLRPSCATRPSRSTRPLPTTPPSRASSSPTPSSSLASSTVSSR